MQRIRSDSAFRDGLGFPNCHTFATEHLSSVRVYFKGIALQMSRYLLFLSLSLHKN